VRALLELAPAADDLRIARPAVYLHEPALTLAVQQRPDGTWGGRILTVPRAGDPTFAGVGMVPAVRRLLECGWEADAPALTCARRLLFRLLAEDVDPAFLFELRDEAGADEALVRRGRAVLREAAASALAQLGLEADPRLRGAAVRMLDRVMSFIRTAAATPEREAPTGPLPTGATPPSAHFLVMLAYMPRFRSEHQDEMSRLLSFLSGPARGTPRQLVGRKEVAQAQVVLGDPLAHVSESTGLPTTLAWLEVLARLGFLRQHAAWSAILDRLLDERDAKGVWLGRSTALATPEHAWDWPTFPLGDPSRESLVADMTFRLALIARLAGRPLDLA
jgi:hypothetical protein